MEMFKHNGEITVGDEKVPTFKINEHLNTHVFRLKQGWFGVIPHANEKYDLFSFDSLERILDKKLQTWVRTHKLEELEKQ